MWDLLYFQFTVFPTLMDLWLSATRLEIVTASVCHVLPTGGDVGQLAEIICWCFSQIYVMEPHCSTCPTGWRNDFWLSPRSNKRKKYINITCCVCVCVCFTPLISIGVILCVPQLTLVTALSAPTSFLKTIVVTFYLEAYHMLTRECNENKSRYGKKKLPTSVFPALVECHRWELFTYTLKIRLVCL